MKVDDACLSLDWSLVIVVVYIHHEHMNDTIAKEANGHSGDVEGSGSTITALACLALASCQNRPSGVMLRGA
jgi:hypothetical protein